MATNIVNIFQAKVINGLDTYNHTALLNSMYTVDVDLSELPPSSVSILIQQNGSTKATAAAPAAGQSNIRLRAVLNCAANDLISVVISSSNAQEAAINTIKGILVITPGQVG